MRRNQDGKAAKGWSSACGGFCGHPLGDHRHEKGAPFGRISC
jgi:hypothetical protein